MADDADNYLPINDHEEKPRPLAALPYPIRKEETELEINVTCDSDHDDKRAVTPSSRDLDTRI